MQRKRTQLSEPEEFQLTSLIDCVFLLLVFFMTTTVFKNPQALVMVLPVSGQGLIIEERRLIAEIDEEGKMALNGQRVYLDNFASRLAREKDMKNASTLSIHADKKTKHGQVLEAMKQAKQVGIERIVMVTDDPREEQVVTEQE